MAPNPPPPYWTSLERRSPTLFFMASGLLVGHAVLRGIRAFTDIPTPMDGFGPAGFLLALIGLVGLYPKLADRSPRLAAAAALVAIVPILDYTVILVWGFAEMGGLVSHLFDIVPGAIFFPVHGSLMILAYGLFGVATLRTNSHPRTVGLLLLAPSLLMIMLLTGSVIIGEVTGDGFMVGSGMVLVHFAIGYSLSSVGSPTDRDAPISDGTTW